MDRLGIGRVNRWMILGSARISTASITHCPPTHEIAGETILMFSWLPIIWTAAVHVMPSLEDLWPIFASGTGVGVVTEEQVEQAVRSGDKVRVGVVASDCAVLGGTPGAGSIQLVPLSELKMPGFSLWLLLAK